MSVCVLRRNERDASKSDGVLGVSLRDSSSSVSG